MSKFKTHYDNLKIPRDASQPEIKTAYKKLIQKYHPDKYKGHEEYALKSTKIILTAYKVLSNSVKRAEHDVWIAEKEETIKNKESADSAFEQSHDHNKNGETPPSEEPPEEKKHKKKKVTSVHPWRRFIARILDYQIAGIIFVIILIYSPFKDTSLATWIISLISKNSNQIAQEWMLHIFAMFFWIPVEGYLLFLFGSTPGKALFNINVSQGINGNSSFFKRSLYVWLIGMLGGIPLFQQLANINAYSRLNQNHVSYWDEFTGCRIEVKPLGFLRICFASILIFTLLLFNGTTGKRTNKKPQAQQQTYKEITQKKPNQDTTYSSQYRKALELYKKGHYSTVLPIFNKFAQQGKVDSQYALGHMYANGYGVSRNDKKAFKWYKKAAEQGHFDAQFELGVSYANGYGVAKNYNLALHWLDRVANKGDKEAQYLIGLMYEKGYGTSINRGEAMYWYHKAANLGHKEAQKIVDAYSSSNFIATPKKLSYSEKKDEQIKTLLQEANRDFLALRLTSPKKNNALDKYLKIQSIDRNNQKAADGIEKIVYKYISLAVANTNKRRYTSAKKNILKGLRIQPNNTTLLRLKKESDKDIALSIKVMNERVRLQERIVNDITYSKPIAVKRPKTFGIGSLVEDVLQIQRGLSYSRNGDKTEILNFGNSIVKVSKVTKRVTSWANYDGNLKTTIKQGNNITSSEVITVGAHLDDVLRLHGQPKSVNGRDWHYGFNKSYIRISPETNKVIKWKNNGDLKTEDKLFFLWE